MFFLTILLHALLAWMRRQPGSSSLRALLYIDELFGFMPPVANPPSKKPLLTLLKQARAFGLGLVLSTQNPVDLDYKGMSNIGTWFIGRLQTERDKARVLEGLRGVESLAGQPAEALSNLLSTLGKRQFLLHNVHESGPVVFATRWAMSYLSGPLSREQIARLAVHAIAADPEAAANPRHIESSVEPHSQLPDQLNNVAPLLDPGIRQKWLPIGKLPRDGQRLVYSPVLLACGSVAYRSARYGVDCDTGFTLSAALTDGESDSVWSGAIELSIAGADMDSQPAENAYFADCPAGLSQARNFSRWEKSLATFLRLKRPLVIYKSAAQKLTSMPGESQRDFRIRLQQKAHDDRDTEVAVLRQRYAAKMQRLEQRLKRAQQTLGREEEQAGGSKVDTAVSIGTAVLGALLGRKRASVTSLSRAGAAARKTGNMRKQLGDVQRAEEAVASVEQEMAMLAEQLDTEVAVMDGLFDAQSDELQEIVIRATSGNIRIAFIGIGWQPLNNTIVS